MSYRNIEINRLVDEIADVLKPYGCVGFRLDYLVTDNGTNRRCFIPERHGVGGKYALMSRRDNIRPKGVKSLFRTLNMNSEDATKVLDLAVDLSEINDMGAWVFDPDIRAEKVAGEFSAGSRSYSTLPGFKADYENLRDALPQIDRVEFLTSTGQNQKGSSRKGFVHFYDGAGDQVSAISINFLATTLREYFGDDEDAWVGADKRLGRWAHQLNSEQPRFIEVARDLIQFDSLLNVTSVDLKGGL